MAEARPLTEGEIRLAKAVFGGAIDYAQVRIHDKPFFFAQPASSGMTPNGEIYVRDIYSADYSKEPPGRRGFFIHEMTHVWQYQNKVLNPVAAAIGLSLKNRFNYGAAYNFSLEDGKDLTAYGLEQQASIVQEYFLLKVKNVARSTSHCQNTCSAPEKMKLFESVLRRFLKDPSYARQKSFRRPPAP